MPNLLAFSGGVDSSYCLHRALDSKFDVIPCFLEMSNGSLTTLTENLLGVMQLLSILKHDESKARKLDRAIFQSNVGGISPPDYGGDNDGLRLQQQVASLDLMRLILNRRNDLCNIMFGHCKDDTVEENFGIGEKTLEEFHSLRRAGEDLISLSQRFKQPPKVLMPCLDKTKAEMFNLIPNYAKPFINVAHENSLLLYITEDDRMVIRVNNYHCDKWALYQRQGINTPIAWSFGRAPGFFSQFAQVMLHSVSPGRVGDFLLWANIEYDKFDQKVLDLKKFKEIELPDVITYYAEDVNAIPKAPSFIVNVLKQSLALESNSICIGERFEITDTGSDKILEEAVKISKLKDTCLRLIDSSVTLAKTFREFTGNKRWANNDILLYVRDAKEDLECGLNEATDRKQTHDFLKAYHDWFKVTLLPLLFIELGIDETILTENEMYDESSIDADLVSSATRC